MFPNLMADDELPDRRIFPDTDTYLFVGGPEHGKRREVIRNDTMIKVMAPPQPSPYMDNALSPATLNMGPAYEAHSYIRRDLGYEDEDGTRYVRHVFVHEGIPNPSIAERLLMAALLADFVKGGRKVVDNANSG